METNDWYGQLNCVGLPKGELMVKLKNIYDDKDTSYSILYQLLAERKSYESISHSEMPTWKQHSSFVSRNPYKHWFIIYDDTENNYALGSLYVTFKNEIGIAIFEKFRRKGYAVKAIQQVMLNYPEKQFLANINPANDKSIKLFEKLGFTQLQVTYQYKKAEQEDAGPGL